MQIVRHAYSAVVVSHQLVFQRLNDTAGSGFAFPCDADGNVETTELSTAGRHNLQNLRAGLMPGYAQPYVDRTERRVLKPSIGKCECGCHVELSGFTNTCSDCGRDYNSAGQLLRDRREWGEETGEHWIDVVNIK
jgi:hypothetical protein